MAYIFILDFMDHTHWGLQVLQTAAASPWCPGDWWQRGPLGLGEADLLSLQKKSGNRQEAMGKEASVREQRTE